MNRTRIAIIGAGLSGLYGAYLLEQRGLRDYVVLEARAAPGGRIASASRTARPETAVASAADIDRFDLGPTWFWPDLQPQLDELIRDLGLRRFAQHETGDLLVERTSGGSPLRMRNYANVPPSMRLIGGMQSLIDALGRRVDVSRILTGRTVRTLRQADTQIEIESQDSGGRSHTITAECVLLALPPRLAIRRLVFAPALPEALRREWHDTPTWMAPHAKYIALYDTAFWREQGLSGDARSMRGPLGEIHDASMPGGSAALFGFFALPAHLRRTASPEILRSACREQMARLFGPLAAAPTGDFIKDWARDPLTATDADQHDPGEHTAAPSATAASGPWQGRLWGISSECSPQFPGYLAGAIEASYNAITALATRDPR